MPADNIAVLTKCGHVFCDRCLRHWFYHSANDSSCPSCRSAQFYRKLTYTVTNLPNQRPARQSINIVGHFSISLAHNGSISCGRCKAPEALLPVALAGCGHVFCWTCISSLLPTPSPRLQRLLQLPVSVRDRSLSLGGPIAFSPVNEEPGRLIKIYRGAFTIRGHPDTASIAASRFATMLEGCTTDEELDLILFGMPLQFLCFFAEGGLNADSPVVRTLQNALESSKAAHCLREGGSSAGSAEVEDMAAYCPQCSQPFNQTYVFPIFSSNTAASNQVNNNPTYENSSFSGSAVEQTSLNPPRVLIPGSSLLQLLDFLKDISVNL
ncbi:hypothetical protein GOP47_0030822 [Adiantum capillus-veneris]|nr:hypothetical protein GOP47_0030822 [Adiantum capillus-veneris]